MMPGGYTPVHSPADSDSERSGSDSDSDSDADAAVPPPAAAAAYSAIDSALWWLFPIQPGQLSGPVALQYYSFIIMMLAVKVCITPSWPTAAVS